MKIFDKYDIYPGTNFKPVETLDNRYKLKRISRWISIRQNYNPNKNNSLWDYVSDENGYKHYQDNFNAENGLFLDYFVFAGKTYAIDQFAGIGSIADCVGHSMYYVENGEKKYISGFDMDNYWKNYFIELDECCEHVRLYEEIEA